MAGLIETSDQSTWIDPVSREADDTECWRCQLVTLHSDKRVAVVSHSFFKEGQDGLGLIW